MTTRLGELRPAALAGVHFTLPEFPIGAPPLHGEPTGEERAALAQMRSLETGSGYAKQQSTRPQTLGYGLADSGGAGRLDLREVRRVDGHRP
ncbi:hypothetical protein [Plantactinospora soyae]|uniref:Uncharacterized protein n=1 Tax=Plantactinospora soyae TaxID=1544732 RepID=A0A927M4H9_9ACTN|nr:hypothetical protein [Plantactinospora soyae]MBE1487564.1 hypothetical protein [Plantactinospora soyae]